MKTLISAPVSSPHSLPQSYPTYWGEQTRRFNCEFPRLTPDHPGFPMGNTHEGIKRAGVFTLIPFGAFRQQINVFTVFAIPESGVNSGVRSGVTSAGSEGARAGLRRSDLQTTGLLLGEQPSEQPQGVRSPVDPDDASGGDAVLSGEVHDGQLAADEPVPAGAQPSLALRDPGQCCWQFSSCYVVERNLAGG